jgi:hypothetical protein
VSATFTVRIGVEREKNADGESEVTDALIGLDMVGKIVANVKLQLGIQKKFR